MANYLQGMLLELHPFLTSMVHDSGKNVIFKISRQRAQNPSFGTAISIGGWLLSDEKMGPPTDPLTGSHVIVAKVHSHNFNLYDP